MNEHRHDESCLELAGRLSEYLDGELSEELASEVARHFQACQRCEEFVQSLEKVRRLGGIVPVPAPSAERRARLVERLRSELGKPRPETTED